MKKATLWYYEFREAIHLEETLYWDNWQVMTKKEFEAFYRNQLSKKHEIWHVTRRKASIAEIILRDTPQYQKRLEADLNGKD